MSNERLYLIFMALGIAIFFACNNTEDNNDGITLVAPEAPVIEIPTNFDKRALEFCLFGLEDAKERYLEQGKLVVDFGALDNKGRAAYNFVLLSYSKELITYGNIPNQYYRNIDSILARQDTFAFYDYCFKQFVDGIVEKKYGKTFYQDVKHKADSLIKHETHENLVKKRLNLILD